MIYRLLLDQASGSLFCRLLKQTAQENLRHKEQLSLFAHR